MNGGGGARRGRDHPGSARARGFAPRVIAEAAAAAAVVLAVTGLAGVVSSDGESSEPTTTTVPQTTTTDAADARPTTTTTTTSTDGQDDPLLVSSADDAIQVLKSTDGTQAILVVEVVDKTDPIRILLGAIPPVDTQTEFDQSACGRALTQAKDQWVEEATTPSGSTATPGRPSTPTTNNTTPTPTPTTTPAPAPAPAPAPIVVHLKATEPSNGPWPDANVEVTPEGDPNQNLVVKLLTTRRAGSCEMTG